MDREYDLFEEIKIRVSGDARIKYYSPGSFLAGDRFPENRQRLDEQLGEWRMRANLCGILMDEKDVKGASIQPELPSGFIPSVTWIQCKTDAMRWK